MRKIQFIRELQKAGFTEYFIGEVLDLRKREREKGIRRKYSDYLPTGTRESQGKQ